MGGWNGKDKLELDFKLSFPASRKVYLHRGQVSSGTSDGILFDPDVHPQSVDCHFVLGLLLDKYGCSPCQGCTGHHHGLNDDHPEFRFQGISAKGKKSPHLITDWRGLSKDWWAGEFCEGRNVCHPMALLEMQMQDENKDLSLRELELGGHGGSSQLDHLGEREVRAERGEE